MTTINAPRFASKFEFSRLNAVSSALLTREVKKGALGSDVELTRSPDFTTATLTFPAPFGTFVANYASHILRYANVSQSTVTFVPDEEKTEAVLNKDAADLAAAITQVNPEMPLSTRISVRESKIILVPSSQDGWKKISAFLEVKSDSKDPNRLFQSAFDGELGTKFYYFRGAEVEIDGTPSK